MEIYHVLNRGVDKRKVFMDKQDSYRFIHDLFEFNDTAPTDTTYNYHLKKKPSSQSLDIGCPKIGRDGNPKIHKRKLLVKVHAFCMMPNHYHLLLSPVVENGISLFMKKLNMGYTKYFNEKHGRSGALWQGKYKSVSIETDSQLFYIPYYIHFNPLDLTFPEWREGKIRNTKGALTQLEHYQWSSHIDYLGKQNFPSVTQHDFLTAILGEPKKYRREVTQWIRDFGKKENLDSSLLLE